jgi:hypothetical protein
MAKGDQESLAVGTSPHGGPDAYGHGPQPLGDAGQEPGRGAAAMAFRADLAFEGLEDRLELRGRELAFQPGVKRAVQEQVRQHG